MKHNRLLGILIAVTMLLVANINAMAQEYVLRYVTFLTPGEKGVVAVGMNNPDPVKVFQGKILLPEGLTFVTSSTREDRFVISKCERSSKFSIALQKKTDREAAFLGFTMSDPVNAGSGDILTFEVNVDKNFKGTSEIQLIKAEINMEGVAYKPADIKGMVANSADQMFASSEEVKVKEGVAATVNLNLDFQKEFLRVLGFDIELPEGLSIVDKSWKVNADRCPNHVPNVINNFFSILYDDIFGTLEFAKKDGNVCSFEVVANDKFVDGSEIILKNINAVAKIDGVNTPFYAEDLHIKVTKAGTTTGINGIESDFAAKADGIYTISGLKVNQLVKGVNIVVKDGKATKVVKK